MKNSYLSEFLDTLRSRYSIDALNMPVSEWVSRNTMLNGKAFNYERYPFQEAIIDDMHPDLACMKCSQIGLSEIQVRKMAAFLYRNQETTGLYSMPNKMLRDSFSDIRVRKVLDDSKVFNSPDFGAQTRRIDLKQIGKSYMVLPNATEAAATSLSVDFLMVDEVDLTDKEVLALYDSRLQNSDHHVRQDFSTPSFEDYGIDASYKSTDKRELLCKCDSCNHWQLPTFSRPFVIIPGLSDSIKLEDITEDMETGLDLTNSRVVCEKCGSDLDLRKNREWVAEKPDVTTRRGYRVRPFSTDRLSVAYIVAQLLRYKKRDFMRGWYNTVLGECYTDVNARIQLADIIACLGNQDEEDLKHQPLFVGIDVGIICHVVIGSVHGSRVVVRKMLCVQASNIVEWVKEFCKTHKVIAGGMDRFPYTPTAEAVFEASGGKIYPVGYTQGKNIVHKNDLESGQNHFEGNRTWMLDAVQKLFKNRAISMNGFGPMREIIKEHLQGMVRNEEPEKQAVWIKLNTEDHFFHALAFFLFGIKVKEYLDQINMKDADIRTEIASMVATLAPVKDSGITNSYASGMLRGM